MSFRPEVGKDLWHSPVGDTAISKESCHQLGRRRGLGSVPILTNKEPWRLSWLRMCTPLGYGCLGYQRSYLLLRKAPSWETDHRALSIQLVTYPDDIASSLALSHSHVTTGDELASSEESLWVGNG